MTGECYFSSYIWSRAPDSHRSLRDGSLGGAFPGNKLPGYVHRVPPGQIRTLCRLLYPSPSALFSTPGIASNGVIGKLYRSRNSPGPAKLTRTWPASSQINTFSGKIQSEIWVLLHQWGSCLGIPEEKQDGGPQFQADGGSLCRLIDPGKDLISFARKKRLQ